MKERPIIFSGPMVQAILQRQKTQTRRVIIPRQPKIAPLEMEPWIIHGEQERYDDGRLLWNGYHPKYPTGCKWFACDYGQPGDWLWVRETWCQDPGRKVWYRADLPLWDDGEPPTEKWHSPIYMPRWASRITLEITDVRVERLCDISEADIKAEGFERVRYRGDTNRKIDDPQDFSGCWDSLNAKRGYSWSSNPWIWIIEFQRI